MKKATLKIAGISTLAVLISSGAIFASQQTDRIESTAKKSYVFVTYLKGEDITVKAINDSTVQLGGTVSEWSHRSLAQETVWGINGVKSVENKIVVKGGEPAENSNIWIAMKVKTILLVNKNVSGTKTDVSVNEGVVTLKGTAVSEAQKELTTEYANDVEGVKSVKNELVIVKTEKSTLDKVSEYIDDASITSQVKLALLFHRSTSVIKTKVDTKDGVVTVSGLAKNAAEKDLVVKLVNNIKGVKGIKNEITIG